MEDTGERIRIRFVTKYEDYRVADAAVAVPSKLGRYGLSEVVNHLLDNPTPVPFDFIINNTLVRTSLRKFVQQNRISTEEVLVVDYIPVTSFSGEAKSSECPAWVGALQLASPVSVFAGCYNGQLRVLCSSTLEEKVSVQAHELPIRSLACWSDSSARVLAATASKDMSVRCWEVSQPKKGGCSLSCLGRFESAISSVECVERWTDSGTDMLVAGDWGGHIFGYRLSGLDRPSQTEDQDTTGKRKKKKINASESTPTSVDAGVDGATVIPHDFSLHAHTQAVSHLQSCPSTGRLYTSSWDHSVKEWDLEKQECVATLAGSKVVTSMNFCRENNLIATSHPDGRVRLWDSRSRDSSVCVNSFVNGDDMHWVSQVKWSPVNSNSFCTSDYDGAVRLWDTRAALPLTSTAAHDGKALCIEWNNVVKSSDGSSLEVFSGGSDCSVKSTPLLSG
mmetsp:Transcript_19865/g.28558  ORF Transcript_19865/g.28558 Transcript_19865/m.28558 type:complete len:449 (+) Transcript_19865:63-1409(+)